MGASSSAASGVVAGEVCAPLLLLCWLCCWPDESHSDTSSSGKPPRKPVVTEVRQGRRASDLFRRRHLTSSAVSLHLPSTSGTVEALSSHRSHEEIPRHLEPIHDTRYHSAPSVIHEVLHRRDWERSSIDLYIPLRSPTQAHHDSDDDDSPNTNDQRPEISNEALQTRTCKKHHTNIKASRNIKELTRLDVKDEDATEMRSSFYIGDAVVRDTHHEREQKQLLKAKQDKQSLNESIRCKERLWPVLSTEPRSGRPAAASCPSRSDCPPPPLSTEPVDYEGGACYLAETGELSSLRRGAPFPPGPAHPRPPPDSSLTSLRSRHASDGDILGPAPRPESGAFSESDLDLDVDSLEERPPDYCELEHHHHLPAKRETAI